MLRVVRSDRPLARRRRPRSTDLFAGQRTQLESHRCRFSFQYLQHVGLQLGLVLFHRLGHVFFTVLEHPVDQTRQRPKCAVALDCLSEPTNPTADPGGRTSPTASLSCPPTARASRKAMYYPARPPYGDPRRFLRLVALVLRGTQPQPTREVFLRRKATGRPRRFQPGSPEGGSHVDPLDQCQIDRPTPGIMVPFCIEADVILFVPTLAWVNGLGLLPPDS